MPSPLSLASIRLRLTRRRLLRGARTRLSTAFGVSPEARAIIVERMLEGHARHAPIYWLQLGIALSLATLGLVLNGTAVVIGAMLVSPLMNPIVELGMGLAVGSPLLAIRSLVRTFWSIVVVIAGAALITAALPFHEVTSEIAARTSPTALDLLVAVFCALAAAFTTLRSASESVTAAAGTAVAIALVPPLCVAGFGLGTADRQIAQGAFLLFTANLCGILLFAALTFWLFGFNLVDTRHLEEKRFGADEPTNRSVRWVQKAFGSRYGTWLRLVIPVVLVAVVWLPLSSALREVTWQVRTRAAVGRIIRDLPLAQAAVRSAVSFEHRTVHVRLVIVGKPNDARGLQLALTAQIAAASGGPPAVEVEAVPDLDTMEEVARRLARAEATELRPRTDLLEATAKIADALRSAWQDESLGPIRRWRLDSTDQEHPDSGDRPPGTALGADCRDTSGVAALRSPSRAPGHSRRRDPARGGRGKTGGRRRLAAGALVRGGLGTRRQRTHRVCDLAAAHRRNDESQAARPPAESRAHGRPRRGARAGGAGARGPRPLDGWNAMDGPAQDRCLRADRPGRGDRRDRRSGAFDAGEIGDAPLATW